MRVTACLAACLFCLWTEPSHLATAQSSPAQPPEQETADLSSIQTKLLRQTERRFTNAILFAPDQSLETNVLARLAPLILQETVPSIDPEPDPFGRVPQVDGAPQDKPAPPVIQVYATKTAIRGQPHEQFTFCWSYPQRGTNQGAAALAAQGIRMTLDAAGYPVIWEILPPDPEFRLLFVAQSLEKRAADRFGAPLAHRRFSVERACTEQPKVWVARLLDQGPIPLGPAVYLEAGTGSVTTLLCRCSPAQVDQIRKTVYYQLAAPGQPPNSSPASPPAWLGAENQWPGLETLLRLPDNF